VPSSDYGYVELVWVEVPSGGSFLLTLEAGSGGDVPEPHRSRTVEVGAVVEVVAVPGDGFDFAGWKSSSGGGLADPSSATTTFTMPAAEVVLTADFTPSSATVVFSVTASFGVWAGSGDAVAVVEADSASFTGLALDGQMVPGDSYAVSSGTRIVLGEKFWLVCRTGPMRSRPISWAG
jgi:uncharacterized repeat protein (TIGR02543 family)